MPNKSSSFVLRILFNLGVTLAEVLEVFTPKEAAKLVAILHDEPKMVSQMLKVMTRGNDQDKDKIKTELDYLAGKIPD